MFDVFCPGHGSRVLLGYSAIDSLANTEHGIEVRYHCECGHIGVWLTGSKAAS